MADEFGDLLDQIQGLTVQLAAILEKCGHLGHDIQNLCSDRQRIDSELADVREKLASLDRAETTASVVRSENRAKIEFLQRQVAILETKADYAKTTCDNLAGSVSKLQEVSWKTVGFAAGVSFTISLIVPWLIKYVFG